MHGWCDYCDDGCEHCQPTQVRNSNEVLDIDIEPCICIAILDAVCREAIQIPFTHVKVGKHQVSLAVWARKISQYAEQGCKKLDTQIIRERTRLEQRQVELQNELTRIQQRLQNSQYVP